VGKRRHRQAGRAGRATGDPTLLWSEFETDFQRLGLDGNGIIYALPFALISQLADVGFLTAPQARFERRFRRSAVTGFANRLPLYAAILDRPFVGGGEFDRTAMWDLERGLTRQQATSMFRDAVPPEEQLIPEPEAADTDRDLFTRPTFRKLKAYAGWLITHPPFREELQVLRSSFAQFVADGALRAYGLWEGHPFIPGDAEPPDQDAVRTSRQLLDRWFLKGMPAWDLPCPQEVTSSYGNTDPDRFTRINGLVLRVPAPLLNKTNIQLSAFASWALRQQDHSHLDEWLDPPRSFGELRWTRLLDLLIYRERALLVRYPNESARRTQLIDRALREFWARQEGDPVSVDSFERIRAMMNQRLRSPTDQPPPKGAIRG
jgi:hypothetical protein